MEIRGAQSTPVRLENDMTIKNAKRGQFFALTNVIKHGKMVMFKLLCYIRLQRRDFC